MPTDNASSTSSNFGGTTPFKVQVNLEGYFSVHSFYDSEKINFALLKAAPHVKDWWETYCEQRHEREPSLFSAAPTWNYF